MKREELKYKCQLKVWLSDLGFKAVGKGNAANAPQLQAFCNKNYRRLGMKEAKQAAEHIIIAIKHRYTISTTGTQAWTPGSKQTEYGDGSVPRPSPSTVILPAGVCDEDIDVTPPPEILRRDSMIAYNNALSKQRQEEMQNEYLKAVSNRDVSREMIFTSVQLRNGDRFYRSSSQTTTSSTATKGNATTPAVDSSASEKTSSSSATTQATSMPPAYERSKFSPKTHVGMDAFRFRCSDDEADDLEDDEADETEVEGDE